jgi:hypothetical protein
MKTETTVSKETFHSFCALRQMGDYNMMSPIVRELLGIEKRTHMEICRNFAKLKELYGTKSDV